ncbi:hypothetical protein HPB48_003054 [Haemaphysalis longicornis]|uniref:Uncharacterized protein n=1 Tax=Haemaphysalis longicornis TaxID=44386 RepID=A0A9J6FCS0_HAELO|nr:hypothetical protein HPB48_003054 [Haemaphysalis longicornis]
MSKNTESSAFRKIDIDQYNEDNYKEEEGLDAQSPPAGPDEQEVNHLLNQYPLWPHIEPSGACSGTSGFENGARSRLLGLFPGTSHTLKRDNAVLDTKPVIRGLPSVVS